MSANHFYYFAYGSNMSTARLTAPDRAPSARALGTGYVVGRRLTFDKVGRDGTAKCDCELTGGEGDRIYGVLFDVQEDDRARLDLIEGLGIGYDIAEVEVVTENGLVKAWTYVATVKDSALRPYHWYKQHVLRGARDGGLPEEYIRRIEAIESIDDPQRP
jgi:cation transport regulator ChaC